MIKSIVEIFWVNTSDKRYQSNILYKNFIVQYTFIGKLKIQVHSRHYN